jgi:molecular chaperone IbpA
MAVAGFGADDGEVIAEENTLTATGWAQKQVGNDNQGLLYQDIAKRTLERRFQLADYIKVASAALGDGLLTIDFAREVPDEKSRIKLKFATQQTSKIKLPKAPLGRLLRADTLLQGASPTYSGTAYVNALKVIMVNVSRTPSRV